MNRGKLSRLTMSERLMGCEKLDVSLLTRQLGNTIALVPNARALAVWARALTKAHHYVDQCESTKVQGNAQGKERALANAIMFLHMSEDS